MASEPDPLIAHVETFLGPIAGGWGADATGERLPFEIVRFDDAPDPDTATFMTLGLSRHQHQSATKAIRQELVLGVHSRHASTQLVSVLATVGELLVASNRPLLRGEVLPPRDAIVPGSPLTAFLATSPGSYPESFGIVESTEPPTVIVQLVPIAPAEVALIESHGWVWFGEQLAKQRIDVFDMERAVIRH